MSCRTIKHRGCVPVRKRTNLGAKSINYGAIKRTVSPNCNVTAPVSQTHVLPNHRTEIGSEGGAKYLVTFEDITNPGDVYLLATHPEGLTGAGATVVAREVSHSTT